MKISEAPMDRLVSNRNGDRIHCQKVTVYANPHDLAGWTGKGGIQAYGYNYATGERVTDPDLEVIKWRERGEWGLS